MESLEFEAARLFYQIAHIITNRTKSRNQNMDYHSGQFKCLLYLDASGEVAQNDLCDVLEIRATSISETLSKLEKYGLIIRKPKEKSKHALMVSITPLGHEAAVKCKEHILEDSRDMFHALTQEEKESFYKSLKKIYNTYIETED